MPFIQSSTSFNPHQLRRAGDTSCSKTVGATSASFNPHQLRRAGDTPDRLHSLLLHTVVSIPTSSEEPVIQSCSISKPLKWIGFNPHQLRRAGDTQSSTKQPSGG